MAEAPKENGAVSSRPNNNCGGLLSLAKVTARYARMQTAIRGNAIRGQRVKAEGLIYCVARLATE